MKRTPPQLSVVAWIRVAFFGLAGVAGAILTIRFNAQWSEQQGGFDLADYVRAGFANSASTSFSIDLIIAAVTGVVFMAAEGARLRMRSAIPLIITTFLIAFAFSFPMFLAIRELRLARGVGVPVVPSGRP